MKDIKIFVSHRVDQVSEIIDNPIYINVLCGAASRECKDFSVFRRDDDGYNVSHKKEFYSELTVMYWAWKNIKADYYGLCHYRRYFSFTQDFKNKELQQYVDKDIYPKGQRFLVYPYITPKAIDLFGLDEHSMRTEIENSDVILRAPVDVRELKGLDYNSALDARKMNKSLHNIEDVNKMIQIIHEKYPEYDRSVEKYYSEPYGQWFDCFIMKKEIFCPFCAWLFDILFELEKRINYEKYNHQMVRAVAYLSEDLFGIYFKKAVSDKSLKVTYKPLVLFQNTNKYVMPVCNTEINVVITCSDNTALITSVTINSIIEHLDLYQRCSIIVLYTCLNYSNIRMIELYNSDNVIIQFVSKKEFWYSCGILEDNDIDEFQLEEYDSVLEAYLLKKMDKAIYLKPGCIVEKNLALLMKNDLKENAFGGVCDSIISGYVNGANEDVKTYYQNHPYKLDQYNQFNCDILLVNLKKIREKYDVNKIIQYIKQDKLPNPQEFLNHLFSDSFSVVESNWNVFAIDEEQGWAIELTPYKNWKEYQNSKKRPFIINYRTRIKPWNSNFADMGEYFWKYARNSYGYEQLLKKYIDYKGRLDEKKEENLLKRIVGILLPKESKRQSLLCNLVKKLKNCKG